MSTHELLEQAAALLEAHGGQKLAEKVRSFAERNIPDVPIYEKENGQASPLDS
jgi:hypothetical protein